MSELGEHLEALRHDPGSVEAAEAVRDAAREAGEFKAYAEAFAERGERLYAGGDDRGAVDAWLEAALVCEEHVHDLPRAAQLYSRVLEVDPVHRRALFALGLVLHDLRRWDDLIALYRRRLAQTHDEGERTTLQQYVAELLAEKKDDPNGGFEALVAAAASAPWNLRILSRLEKLGERTGRLEEVAIAIGDMLMHQEEPRLRAALSLRLGEMHLGPIDDPVRALAHLRSALVDDGANPEVLGEIEDFFRERARFDQLAAFLEEAIQDQRIEPHRARLQRELARIYEYELNDRPRALLAFTRALALVPYDRDLIEEVMRVGVLADDLGSVARAYEGVVSATDNPLLATYLRLKLGQIYANVLGRPGDARRAYQAILDAEPGHLEASRRLQKLLARVGGTAPKGAASLSQQRQNGVQSAPVPKTHADPRVAGAAAPPDSEQAIKQSDESAFAGVLSSLARIEISSEREDADEAAELLWQATRPGGLGVQPSEEGSGEDSNPEAAKVLAALLPLVDGEDGDPGGPERRGVAEPVELVDIIDEAESGYGLREELVDDRFERPPDTLDVAVMMDEGSEAGSTASDLMPGLALAPAFLSDEDASVEVTGSPYLRSGLASATASNVLPLTGLQADSADDELGDALIDMPPDETLHHRTGPPDGADQMVSLTPLPSPSRQFGRAGMTVEDEQVRLEVFEESIHEFEGPERSTRRLEVAQAWQEEGLFSEAERVLREGIQERADDRDLLTALADLLETSGRWSDWLDVADRQLEVDPALADSIELRLRMVEVARDTIGDRRLAWRLADEATARDTGDLRPLQALEALARDAEDLDALAQVLDRMVPLRPHDVALHRALGDTLVRIGQPRRAAEALARACELDPEDLDIAWALADLRLDLGDYEEAEVCFLRLSQLGFPSARATAFVRLAELRLENPERQEEALEAIEAALESDPRCLDALALACSLAESSGDPGRACALAERCAALESDTLPRANWLRRAAELADHGVGDGRRAVRLYRSALELDPDDPESEARVGALLLERGEADAGRAHMLRAAAGLRDEERAAELFEKAGLAAEASGDKAAALAAYDEALERSGTRRVALARASALHAERGEIRAAHDRAASLILHHEPTLNDAERAEAFRNLARAKQEEGDAVGALRLAERAAEAAPSDPTVLSLVAEALEGSGRGDDAVDVLRRLAARQPAGFERAATLERAAELLNPERAADRARRVVLFEEALRETPDDIELAEKLATARSLVGDRLGQAEALEQAARSASGIRRARLATQAAEVVRTIHRARATSSLEMAVQAAPGYAPAVEALEVILARNNEHRSRIEVLEQAAEAALEDDPIASARWRWKAARIAEGRLRRPDRALQILASNEPTAQIADLLFRRAVEQGHGLDRARRVWAARSAAYPGQRLCFARLAELHLRAGAESEGRFVFELSSLLFGSEVPEDAPPPTALPQAQWVEPDDGELDAPERSFLMSVGFAPLHAFRTDLAERTPRRKDAAGPAALGIRASRPLAEAAEALHVALPLTFVQERGGAPFRPGLGPEGPCIFFDPVSAGSLDEVALRFYAGRALSLLRPEALALHLLPPEILRSAAYGLADMAPHPGDPVNAKTTRRRGKLLARALSSGEASYGPWINLEQAEQVARSWLQQPRRSLNLARSAVRRTAHRVGLMASGSPKRSIELVSEADSPNRARLLRFAIDALVLLSPEDKETSTGVRRPTP